MVERNIHTVNHKARLKNVGPLGPEPWFSSQEAYPAPFLAAAIQTMGGFSLGHRTVMLLACNAGLLLWSQRSWAAGTPCLQSRMSPTRSTSGAALCPLWLLFPSTKDMKRQMGKDTNPIPYILPVCGHSSSVHSFPEGSAQSTQSGY